jgi:hypothetical protein
MWPLKSISINDFMIPVHVTNELCSLVLQQFAKKSKESEWFL